ncbi:MAG: NnrU family protein [Pseudomonadales bacterium]|jgi:uncharacterized membrane protein|nr:NnrU family protein [Pseudomonadales bacterium]
MILLIVGLLLFLGLHSVRLLAPAWRERWIARHGMGQFRVLYSVVSLLSFALVVYGYGLSRGAPAFLYVPPLWTRHLAILLTWLAFVLVAAGYAPANALRARLGHPIYAGVKVWAFAHLLANGRTSDVLLFGGFLLWAIAGFAIRRRQDRAAHLVPAPATVRGNVGALVGGTLLWALFAWWLHPLLIGVSPLRF